MNKESVMMVKPLFRGTILAILTMGLQGSEVTIMNLGASMVVYALAMKGFNVMARQLEHG